MAKSDDIIVAALLEKTKVCDACYKLKLAQIQAAQVALDLRGEPGLLLPRLEAYALNHDLGDCEAAADYLRCAGGIKCGSGPAMQP